MPVCQKCGQEISGRFFTIGNNVSICLACAEELEKSPQSCPVCGHSERGDEAVALLLTRATATPAERIGAHSALVHICPKCHGMYFDNFQYRLLELLKQAG